MAYTTFKLPIGYRLYDREQNKVVPLTLAFRYYVVSTAQRYGLS